MPFYQAVSIVGSVLLLFAYAGMQVGKISTTSYLYQMCNLLGAACLTYSVIEPFNIGVFITESVWTVFSLVGLWKTWTTLRARRSHQGDEEAVTVTDPSTRPG